MQLFPGLLSAVVDKASGLALRLEQRSRLLPSRPTTAPVISFRAPQEVASAHFAHNVSADALPTQKEHINLEGTLSNANSQGLQAPAFHIPPPVETSRAPGMPATAPRADPVSEDKLQRLVGFMTSCKRIIVLTGAGVSTESRIPDYRGPSGAYTTGYKPMSHQKFMAKSANRSRYWARNFAGWGEFSSKEPNAAHDGLARLQQRGWVDCIITQNVDRLHQRAGASDVLELHGTTHRVICTGCGVVHSRFDLQHELGQLNPAALNVVNHGTPAQKAALRKKLSETYPPEDFPQVRPDGDVELLDSGAGFNVPDCRQCGGILKPDVVFFGDAVPAKRAQRALSIAESGDGMLVVGSSVMVYSAFRLVKAAKAKDASVAIVNVGETRADGIADIKVEAIAGEVMARLATHPSLLLSRPVLF